jgi:hypothetical protein
VFGFDTDLIISYLFQLYGSGRFILHLRDEVRSHLLFSNCLHHFQQDIYALIHLFRNSMFIIAMVGIAAGAQVGAGKAPEGELGAVRSPANRSGDRRQSDSTDS